MIIIIGLGNPGEKFKNTRHNVGFEAIDKFAKNNEFESFAFQKALNAEIAEGKAGKEKVVLAKPQTFMNDSGKSARTLAKKYAKKSKDFIVLHDDADLPIGSIKIVKERGSAGHKGVESVIRAISNKDLVRIRIGISAKKKTDAMDIVLKKFSKPDQLLINKAVKKTAEALELFFSEGLEKTMGRFNQ